MKHFHDEVRIEAPLENAWAAFLDATHGDDRIPQRETSQPSGPLDRVGTTYVQTVRLMGVELQWTNEVVEVEPLRLIHVHSDDVATDSYFRFEPDGNATRLLIDGDVELPDHLPAFIAVLMSSGWMERNLRRMCVGELHPWHWPE